MKLKDSDIKSIKRRIRLAEQFNEKELKDKFVRSLELYEGCQWPDRRKYSERSRVVVNYILHVTETSVHSVAFKYPEFTIQPETKEGAGTERVAKAALRWSWNKAGAQRELKRAFKDSKIFGTGVVYQGWLFETWEGERFEDGRPAQVGDEEQDTTPNPSAETYTETVTTAEVREDRWFIKRINPGYFFVNPECDRVFENASYCGYWELRPLEEVKKNKHFQNTRQLKGSTANLNRWFDQIIQREVKDELCVPSDLKRVKLYHYFEKQRRIHAIFCDEHDKPLFIEQWGWEFDKYPFEVIQNPGSEDEFWGMSLPLSIEHQQRELNESRSQLSNFRRMANPKFQTQGNTLSDKAKNELKSADPLVIVEHNGGIPESIIPIQQPTIQPEVYTTEERLLKDMQTIAAIDPYDLGNVPTKRQTTSETQAVQNQGGARMQNDRQEFEDLCARVATDCIRWLKQYSVKTRSIPIYDEQDNVMGWQDFTRDQIVGDYDISVFATSTMAPNSQNQMQDIGFLLQSLNPLLQLLPVAQQSGINLIPLVKQVFNSIPSIRNVNEIIQGLQGTAPQPPQMAMGATPQPGMGQGGVGFPPVDTRTQPDLSQLLGQLQGQQ